jgi:NlpC/P60 family putative phage cell wall peptidase
MNGARVVEVARGWEGTPFHWQASLKGIGCDCLGFVAGVARELGVNVAFRADYGNRVDPRELRTGLAAVLDQKAEAEPGDVLLLKVAGKAIHLAIFCGNERMIHTYSKGPARVIEVPMGRVWRATIDRIWRWRNDD